MRDITASSISISLHSVLALMLFLFQVGRQVAPPTVEVDFKVVRHSGAVVGKGKAMVRPSHFTRLLKSISPGASMRASVNPLLHEHERHRLRGLVLRVKNGGSVVQDARAGSADGLEAKIRAVIDGVMPQLNECYESALLIDPSLQETVSIGFGIGESRMLSSLSLKASRASGPATEKLDRCVKKTLRALAMPEGSQGRRVVFDLVL